MHPQSHYLHSRQTEVLRLIKDSLLLQQVAMGLHGAIKMDKSHYRTSSSRRGISSPPASPTSPPSRRLYTGGAPPPLRDGVLSPTTPVHKESKKKSPQSSSRRDAPKKPDRTFDGGTIPLKTPMALTALKAKATPVTALRPLSRSSPRKSKRSSGTPWEDYIPPPSMPRFVDTLKADAKRLEDLQAQLVKVEQQKVSEIQAIKAENKMKRKEIKAKLRGKIAETQAERDEERLDENRQLIDTLRQENNKIRERNKVLAQNCRNLKTNNERLEESSKQYAGGYYGKLQDHHKRAVADNDKLKRHEKEVFEKLREVQGEMDLATRKAQAEHSIRNLYINVMNLTRDRVKSCEQQEVRKDVDDLLDLLKAHEKNWTPAVRPQASRASPTKDRSSPKKSPKKKATR